MFNMYNMMAIGQLLDYSFVHIQTVLSLTQFLIVVQEQLGMASIPCLDK